MLGWVRLAHAGEESPHLLFWVVLLARFFCLLDGVVNFAGHTCVRCVEILLTLVQCSLDSDLRQE
ncbi:hypothetical protein D3C85_1683090 [compost metagenome]